MDGFDLTGIEELQAQLQGNAILRLDDYLPNPIDMTPRNVPEATRENLSDLEDEVVLPTPTGPPISGAQSSHADTWAVCAGDAHAGLEVFTVGHVMPRGSGETGSGSFESGALVGNQEASGGSAQTLRVRRSTFVPGWAVPPRVLLVDDDAVTRKLSTKFLKIFGCTTDVAVDGVSAVNKMNLEKYDLVLMVRFHFPVYACSGSSQYMQDIVMPKMDGISATSMIRKFDPQTPIISMTSSSRPTEIMTYFSSGVSSPLLTLHLRLPRTGMNDILPKPFKRDGLLEVLEVPTSHPLSRLAD
jgi:osomolarity two-component system response regulator SKN7